MKIFRLLAITILLGSCAKQQEVVEDFYEDGAPKTISIYKISDGGSKKIEETTFYPDGKKKMHGNIKNNKRHGEWKAWHKNGLLWSTGQYENGLRQGVSKVYYENGQLYIEGSYKDDEAKGTWIWYDEKGNVLKEHHYDE